MEISIPVKTMITQTNIVDPTAEYDPTEQIAHGTGQEYKDGEGKNIYVRTGDTVFPHDYDSNDEGTYVVDQILFKDGKITKVTATNPKNEPKQPEDYSHSDSGFAFNSFSYRYSLLKSGLNSPSFHQNVNGTTHRLYKNGAQWKYHISWAGDDVKYFEHEKYDFDKNANTVNYGVIYINDWDDDSHDQTKWKYNGATVRNVVGVSAAKPVPNQTIITGADGVRYRVGTLREQYDADAEGDGEYNSTAYVYAISKEITSSSTVTREDDALVYYGTEPGMYEPTAYPSDDPNTNDRWLGRSFIFRNGNLYVRTQVVLPAEENIITVPTYAAVMVIEDFPGYTLYQAVDEYKTIDNKRYTYVERVGSPAEITMRLHAVSGRFDTLAIAGLIADSVDAIFMRPDGSTINSITGYKPNNMRDINNILPPYQTTAILYSDIIVEEAGWVDLVLKGDMGRVGTTLLGQSTNAGFTNLEFSNTFDDYSPTEKDQWGNVTYIDGYRAIVHSGSVDIPITSYDMMTRLMTSIGGAEVIINGSDSKNNKEADSKCIFSSTMLIGRMSSFQLQTRLDKKKIGDMATYTFKIEETV